MAAQKAMQDAGPPFSETRVLEWFESQPLARGLWDAAPDWVKFAHWLRKTGTTSMRSIISVLEECARLAPANPYAYFSPGGGARNNVQMDGAAKAEVGKHEEIKRQDAALFPRRTGGGL
jgi:hypothetical protein